MDRRETTFAKSITATAFAQTQTKKPKSKKTRAPKLRKVGTSALNKQKKLKRVNETFLKLEQDCRNLLDANAQLKKENAKLRKTMELHAGDVCSANNEAMAFKSQWDEAEEYNSKLAVELQSCKNLLNVQLSPDKVREECNKAYNAGLSEFAWWKDCVQYVGTCGKLLKDYLK